LSYDNTCKYLAEKYPADFARWLLGSETSDIQAKKQEALQLILRLLTRRFGAIEPEIEQQIRTLSITQLEELAKALLDFSSQSDLVDFLQKSLFSCSSLRLCAFA